MDRSSQSSRRQRDNSLVLSLKVLRHRENEKQRHQNMTTALEDLQTYVPGQPERETQINSLFRVARYVMFLQKIDRQRESINVSQLPAVYESCEAEVGRLNELFDQRDY